MTCSLLAYYLLVTYSLIIIYYWLTYYWLATYNWLTTDSLIIYSLLTYSLLTYSSLLNTDFLTTDCLSRTSYYYYIAISHINRQFCNYNYYHNYNDLHFYHQRKAVLLQACQYRRRNKSTNFSLDLPLIINTKPDRGRVGCSPKLKVLKGIWAKWGYAWINSHAHFQKDALQWFRPCWSAEQNLACWLASTRKPDLGSISQSESSVMLGRSAEITGAHPLENGRTSFSPYSFFFGFGGPRLVFDCWVAQCRSCCSCCGADLNNSKAHKAQCPTHSARRCVVHTDVPDVKSASSCRSNLIRFEICVRRVT